MLNSWRELGHEILYDLPGVYPDFNALILYCALKATLLVCSMKWSRFVNNARDASPGRVNDV